MFKQVRNFIAVCVAAATFTGCAIEFGPRSSSQPVRYTDTSVSCSPADYDYLWTEFDCEESLYEIEICDPDGVYLRRGCVEWWQLPNFDDCLATHVCESGASALY